MKLMWGRRFRLPIFLLVESTALAQQKPWFRPDQKIVSIRHEDIINKLDAASKTFNVLIIKTNMTLPYTSVFLELRAAYWSDEAEQRLRQSIR